MSRKSKSEKLKISQNLQEIAKEMRHRSRLFFSNQKKTGHIIESRKNKPVKHKRREEQRWYDG